MDANPVNIYEYEALAKGKLGQGEYDFIAGGATDEITLRRTRAVFDAIMLRPRMMVDISQRDLRTTVLGQEIRFPILLDPAGNHAAAHPAGRAGQRPGGRRRRHAYGAERPVLPHPGGGGAGGHRSPLVPAVFFQGAQLDPRHGPPR